MKKIILVATFVAIFLSGCRNSSNNDPQPNNSNNPNNPSTTIVCRPSQINVPSGNATLNYNTNKQITTIDLPNNRSLAFTYTDGKITRFTETLAAGENPNSGSTSTFNFTYNAQNQVTGYSYSINGGTEFSNTISYTTQNNITDITLNYRHIGDGVVYPFLIKVNAQNAVTEMRLNYQATSNCSFPAPPSQYSHTHTPTYAANAPKSPLADLNIPLAIRFFLNRYFANDNNGVIAGFFNPRGTMYLSNLAPATISYNDNSLACNSSTTNQGTANYTHTSNSNGIVTSTSVTINPQGGSSTSSSFGNTQSCN